MKPSFAYPQIAFKPTPQLIFATLILILGLYLRIEPAIFNLTHFSFDQAEDIILVKKLVVDKKLSLISRESGLDGVFMGPFYTWVMAPAFLLFNGNPNGNVLYLSAISILTAIFTYYIIRKMANKTSAFIAFTLAILSPPFIGSSKIVLSPALLTFITIFLIWFMHKIIFDNNAKYFIPLAFFLSLLFHFEIGFAVVAIPSSLLTIMFFRQLKPFRNSNFVRSIGAFIIPFLPQILFDLRHNFIITNAVLNFINGKNRTLGFEGVNLSARIITRAHSFSQDLLSVITFKPHDTTLVLLTTFILGYGWHLAWKDNNTKFLGLGKMIFIYTMVSYAAWAIFPGPVWPWYRAGMPIFFAILFSLSLAQIAKTKELLGRIGVAALLIFLIANSIQLDVRALALNGHYVGDVATSRNQQKVIDAIYIDAQTRDFSVYVYTPPVYPYIWDYQFYSYAQKTYKYQPLTIDVHPQTNNPELIYLIIEPTDNQFLQNGWKDNFTHFGEVIQTWEFQGNIQLEKWKFSKNLQHSQPIIRPVNIF